MKKTLVLMCIGAFFIGCSDKNANVAIRVNGKPILKTEVTNATEMIKQTILSTFPEKSVEGMPENLSKDAAQQLIANELMFEEAKKRNIVIEQASIDETYNKFKSRFGDTAVFNKQLLESGQTEKTIKSEMEKGAMLDSLLNNLLQGVGPIDEQECLTFYNENNSKFTGAPRVRASQIFFKTDTSDKKKSEETKKRALGVLAQIKSGKNFGALAAKFDEGPGKANMGDIGWFKAGDLKPELEKPLQSIGVGSTTDLVCTDAGYHILMKTDEDTSTIRPFAEVRENIHMMINLKKRNDYLKQFIDSLESNATIVFYDTSLISHKD